MISLDALHHFLSQNLISCLQNSLQTSSDNVLPTMLRAPDLAKGVSFFKRAWRIISYFLRWFFRPFYKRCRVLRYIGYLIICLMVLLCVIFYEHVPITGRGRVNFAGSSRGFVGYLLDFDLSYLPESHPAVVRCYEVLQRLLSANGLENSANWILLVVDAPCKIYLPSPAFIHVILTYIR